MADLERREALRLIAASPFAIGLSLSIDTLWAAHRHAATAISGETAAYVPRFFSADEWETLRLLVDFILPADERSGSATDAGVPEFIDFIMTDPEEEDRELESRQTAMRGGLGWIDAECQQRFGRPFVTCSHSEQTGLLDDIAYGSGEPDEAEPLSRDLRIVTPSHGRAFFNSLRDLTASGFWSSRIGVEDLEYLGNTVFEWTGPPAEVLRRLGIEE